MMYNVVGIEGIPCTSTFIIIISRCPVGPSVFIVKLIFFDDECDVNFLNKITRFFTWSLKRVWGHSFFISIMERVWAITACLTLLVFEGDFAWLFFVLLT